MASYTMEDTVRDLYLGKIQAVEFGDIELSEERLSTLLPACASCKKLRRISINNIRIPKAQTARIFTLLSKCPYLEILSIQKLTWNDGGIIGSSLQEAKVEDEISSLTDTLKEHQNLKKLELTGFALKEKAMKRLLEAMAPNKILTEVVIDMNSASRKAREKESRIVCFEKEPKKLSKSGSTIALSPSSSNLQINAPMEAELKVLRAEKLKLTTELEKLQQLLHQQQQQQQHERSSVSASVPLIPRKSIQLLGAPLGKGAYGEVWKAMLNGTPVAVKKTKHTDTAAQEALEAEAAIHCRLRHPNILLFVGMSRDPDGSVLMIMEYMSGGTLYHLLHEVDSDQRRFYPSISSVAKLRLATDIAQGLNCLHMLDPPIYHRDLKSENILLDRFPPERAKLADFGLTGTVKTTISQTMLVGTPIYSAPEVFRTEKYDARVDIYAYALVLFEIFTGSIAYDTTWSYHKLYQQVVLEQFRPPIPTSVPKTIAKIITQCWSDDAEQRPPMSEVIDVLHRIKSN